MVTRLADDVWWFDYQGTSAYLLRDGDAVTLVDTGMSWHASRLQRDLRSTVGGVDSVDRVLITHFDFDHVGGLTGLIDAGLDAPIHVGEADEPYLAGREKPTWQNRKGLLQRVTELTRSVPAVPVETVADGDDIGGFKAYHTPGHTPGHTAFVHEGRSVAMVGDLVRERGGAFEVPPWFLNYDQERAERSLRSFVDRAPDCDIVCQGHGTPVTDRGTERLATCAGGLTTA